MNDYSSNIGSLNGSYTYQTCSCGHRLPCGYCPLLNRVCPMEGVKISPYWTEVTCQTNKEDET